MSPQLLQSRSSSPKPRLSIMLVHPNSVATVFKAPKLPSNLEAQKKQQLVPNFVPYHHRDTQRKFAKVPNRDFHRSTCFCPFKASQSLQIRDAIFSPVHTKCSKLPKHLFGSSDDQYNVIAQPKKYSQYDYTHQEKA